MSNIDIKKLLMEKATVIDSIIEKYIPKKYTKDSMDYTCGVARYEYDIEASNKAVADPVWDLLGRGGKRWRPTLFLLVSEALGGDVEKIKDFVIIPEVVHNGTLMIDDIEDSSEFRRGDKCTHLKFGTDIAVNAGNAMYYLPLLPFLRRKGNFPPEILCKAYEVYIQEMINISFGQGMDIVWHKGLANADNLNEKQYLQMCAYKTGTLARMSAKIATILANGTDEQINAIGKLAETVGIGFQIQDDVLNLTPSGVSETKGCCGEDITEGKRTLIVIHTLKNASDGDRTRLIEILNMHSSDQALRDEAIELMKKYDSINYAKEFARDLVRVAWDEVDKMLEPSEAKDKLCAFARFLIEREI